MMNHKESEVVKVSLTMLISLKKLYFIELPACFITGTLELIM